MKTTKTPHTHTSPPANHPRKLIRTSQLSYIKVQPLIGKSDHSKILKTKKGIFENRGKVFKTWFLNMFLEHTNYKWQDPSLKRHSAYPIIQEEMPLLKLCLQVTRYPGWERLSPHSVMACNAQWIQNIRVTWLQVQSYDINPGFLIPSRPPCHSPLLFLQHGI